MFDDNKTDGIDAERKIGENRGKPRLWLEGQILTDAGFAHGDAWQLWRCNGGAWHIMKGDTVPGVRVRKIAGTAARPIIDMSGATVANMGFKSGDVAGLIGDHGAGLLTLYIAGESE